MKNPRQTRTTSKIQPMMVRCRDCTLSIRDTSGPSFNIATHEYFMGTCPKGHADGRVFINPDGTTCGKVFMDKARVCEDFNNLTPYKQDERQYQTSIR